LRQLTGVPPVLYHSLWNSQSSQNIFGYLFLEFMQLQKLQSKIDIKTIKEELL